MKPCLSCLKLTDKESYCSSCRRKLFQGKIPKLDLSRAEFTKIRLEYIDHFSISGVQDKISLRLNDNILEPTDINGEYILKPVPRIDVPQLQNDIPANEHITMQIAEKIFKIKTAENGLTRFSDGEYAYITKRFDRINGIKIQQEDFCQLLGKSPDTFRENFKYTGSYQEAGEMLKKFCAAYPVEIEKYFSLILFNYLLGNGDAHFKNFSLLESASGDFILSPAYDLVNTNIHFPSESRLAIDLFTDYESQFFKANGFYGKEDFLKLAELLGVVGIRATKIITTYLSYKEQINNLVKISYLSPEAKQKYSELITDRYKALNI